LVSQGLHVDAEISDLKNLNVSEDDRVDVLREFMTMVLYLSIVLLATLAALPSGTEASGDSHGGGGIHGLELVGLIWGTTIGLALAHWFAFRLTAKAFSGGKPTEGDFQVGLAQVAAAAGVAALCTLPVVMFGDSSEVQAATVVPGVIVGIAGYFTARAGGRSKTQALILGGIVMVLGLTVAAVKNFLGGH
jgi:hypothetical protein